MKEFSVSLGGRIARIDWIMLGAAILIAVLSLCTLGGSIDHFGTRRVLIQSAAALIGIFMVLFVSLFDYDAIINKLVLPIFVASVLLLAAVMIFGDNSGGNNNNWINLGFINIQPSEFVKILFIITFSKHLDRVKAKINHPLSVLQLAVHAGIIVGMLLITGDLGTALVYCAIIAAMLFVAGLSIWYFIGAAILFTVAFPFLWEYLDDYQQKRILVGFNPELDPLDKGFQALLSKKAIAAGGFGGSGITGGTVFKQIPIVESDFLFAALCEKLGFAGALTYMLLLGTIIVRLIMTARHARKDYAAFICTGVAAVFIAQALENIGMCLAMLPVVGITLPFFSYGGSSMLSMFLCLSVVESIHTHNEKYYFEREKS